MRNLILPLVFLLLLPLSAISYEGFRCIPSLRQTRLQVLVVGEHLEIMVVNPSGYEFMPQFDGAGSQYSLAFNRMQAEDLKEFGSGFTFRWPKEKCTLNSENFEVNCEGLALNQIGPIKSYGFTTTEVTEKIKSDVYEKRKFRFSAEKDNFYFASLEFYKQTCEKF